MEREGNVEEGTERRGCNGMGEGGSGRKEGMGTLKISVLRRNPHKWMQEVVLVSAVYRRLQDGSDGPVKNIPVVKQIPNRSPNQRLLGGMTV